MVYIVGAAAIGAGMSYYEGEQNRKAAGDAADQSSAAALQGSEAYKDTIAPWYNSGVQANTLLNQNDFYSNIPAFNFNLNTAMGAEDTGGQMSNEAMSEISAQRAATGGYGSGNQITDVSNYIAGTYEPSLYNQALSSYNTNVNSQYTQPYNQLMGVSNTGLSAATGIGNILNTGITNAGNAQAAGTMGSSNATTNAMTGVSNAANSGAGMYLTYLQNQNLADRIKGLYGNSGGGADYSADSYGYGTGDYQSLYSPTYSGSGY